MWSLYTQVVFIYRFIKIEDILAVKICKSPYILINWWSLFTGGLYSKFDCSGERLVGTCYDC